MIAFFNAIKKMDKNFMKYFEAIMLVILTSIHSCDNNSRTISR